MTRKQTPIAVIASYEPASAEAGEQALGILAQMFKHSIKPPEVLTVESAEGYIATTQQISQINADACIIHENPQGKGS